MESFYSVVASENDSFFGLKLNLNKRSTTYVNFRRAGCPFEVAHCHATTAYAGNDRIAFFDYSGCVFGVVDALEGRILWTQSIKSHSDLKCLWAEPGESFIRVQLNKSFISYDITTGAKYEESKIDGILKAAGPDYAVVAMGGKLSVRTKAGELQFKLSNSVQSFVRFGSVLGVIERQGPARAIDLEAGKIVFEALPEPASEFSQIHYGSGGIVILTQHFFDQPILTDVRIYDNPSVNKWHDSTIAMSGDYAILSNGREIAFATRGIFDPKSGEQIGSF